ncbi:c-type cytochrome domain-containing protein [Sandaracinus amylolyticus]|uniref:c-type cytochrome domain-containing protein n=1 Tax=Sandaracinus amylolyticus TaxID=927083 RepID=UPI001F4190E2|nr:c-type cytochrome domain-containing protein [Sandaracinus amylolyticus]UJR79525.1 Cytochrome c domain-containing protein [Sandaracinus amylolyticus]
MRRALVLVVVLLGACEPPRLGLDRREPNPTCRGRATFPDVLADTGCFEPGSSTPIAALLPYDVRVPLWSDGAEKERFVALPDDERLEVDDEGRVVLPPGGVLVKTFRAGAQPIETRLLVRDEQGVWHAATYLWNEAGSEARRFEGGTVERGGLTWDVPREDECFDCHVDAAGVSLGLELAQLDTDVAYAATGRTASQLETLVAIGALAREGLEHEHTPYEPDDVRAYLHVQCAHCHRPGGSATVAIDLRADTDERWMNVIDQRPERGDPEGEAGILVAPGAPERSVLYQRLTSDDPTWRMPPLGTRRVDTAGVARVAAWIEAMGE